MNCYEIIFSMNGGGTMQLWNSYVFCTFICWSASRSFFVSDQQINSNTFGEPHGRGLKQNINTNPQRLTTRTILPEEFESATNHQKLLWKGRPKLIPFVLSRYVTGLILLVLIGAWLFAGKIVQPDYDVTGGLGLWLGLFPLCIFLWILIKRGVLCKHTFYSCSKKSITIKSGTIQSECKRIAFDEIEDVKVTVNAIEKICGVGTISFYSGNTQLEEGNPIKVYDSWEAIPNPYEVFENIKLLMIDATVNHAFAASPFGAP